MHSPANRLIRETSHYLLQHAHNPVDWHPWGEDALARARAEDKPIFLSIGYSTCHWCHVMAHECFADEGVAALMNQHLINIKVDREERPDIDQVYMAACHVLGRRGGWPLSVFMGPDGRPFFIATYIPRESGFGRMGMLELIPRVATIWSEQRREILASGMQIEEALRANQGAECVVQEPDMNRAADEAYHLFVARFDPEHGGFGNAPKFPAPHTLLFLLEYARARNEPKALEMVETTLRCMRLGGVFDHVGFGFHRYSTDERWLLPHFEKMLYDQAMLLMAYTEAWLATQNPLFRQTVAEIAKYVLDQLVLGEGGFGSGQDADSEGQEGTFYVWTREELLAVLGPDHGEWVCQTFGVLPEGNFLEEATGQRTGANILHLAKVMTDPRDQERWEILRNRLALAREHRPRPLTDDGVLADWNGLLIAALAKAGKVFEEPGWLETARSAADFLLTRMRDAHGRMRHRSRSVTQETSLALHVSGQGFLDDQAFVVWGLLELYAVDQNRRYLTAAEELIDIQLQFFSDETQGGFYFTASDGEMLLFRPKEGAEGALPSGNAVSAGNLLRMSELTGNSLYREEAEKIKQAFGKLITTQPHGCAHWLAIFAFQHATPGSNAK
ncbi:MAG: thioredoxin domain-containing protein [Desulfovibrionales bacterium]|nr:MAG: thioredoxin domain-containing protein [Desulfovibrionales bacterium]